MTRWRYAAALGLTALLTGEHDIADGAYQWFVRLWDSQPALPRFLYGAWGPTGLVTQPDETDRFRCIIDFELPRQSFYTPGISAAFLVRYHMATGDSRARELALQLLLLNQNGTPVRL